MKLFFKRHICFIIIIMLFCSACEVDPPKVAMDAVGKFTWAAWQTHAGWDTYIATDYTPDPDIIEKLKPKLKNSFSFLIYGSSWCHADCKTQMPRIVKFLTTAGINENAITIIGVSRDKTEPQEYISQYFQWFPEQIRLSVPTIIILDNDKPLECIKAETVDFPDWQSDIEKNI